MPSRVLAMSRYRDVAMSRCRDVALSHRDGTNQQPYRRDNNI